MFDKLLPERKIIVEDVLRQVIAFLADYVRVYWIQILIVLCAVYVVAKKAYDLLIFIAILVFAYFLLNTPSSLDILNSFMKI